MYDMLALLDVLSPLKAVMTAVQSHSIAPWKPVIYIQKLLYWMQSISFEEGVKTPLLSARLEGLKQKEFKGNLHYCILFTCCM